MKGNGPGQEISMKKRLVFILLLLFSFTLLTACNSSKEDVNKLVKDYVQEKYGFDVDIRANEENGGNRTVVVTQTEKPNLTFEVMVSGALKSKVSDDTYFVNKSAHDHSLLFTKQNKKKLEQFDYAKVKFTPSTSSQHGFNLSVEMNQELSLNNEKALADLLEFIRLVNLFDDETLQKENLDDLTITAKNSDLAITLQNIEKITKINDLVKQLSKDNYLVNTSMFEKNKPAFTEIATKLEKIGYKYKNGITLGTLTGSFVCMDQDIKNGKCVGGYEVNLEGPADADSLLKLVQTLNNQTIKFKNVYLPGGDKPVKLDNIEDIKTIKQINEILDKK
jgi:hypothetical protein